jgi:hypothetical protein
VPLDLYLYPFITGLLYCGSEIQRYIVDRPRTTAKELKLILYDAINREIDKKIKIVVFFSLRNGVLCRNGRRITGIHY